MDTVEPLTAAEQKEFAKWMKFHSVYKSMEKQTESDEGNYEDEGKPGMNGSKMLMAGRGR